MNEVFYIVRHGETDWNVLRRLQGHSDISLNENGRKQALGLSSRISHLRPDVVVSSDLQRAVETAKLTFPGVSIFTHTGLREVYLGEAEGLTREEVQLKWGEDLWNEWSSNDQSSWKRCLPGGESKNEMLQRLESCLHLHLNMFSGKRVIFFSHGLAMRSFAYLKKEDLPESFIVENCGILKIKRTSNEFEVLDYYDQSRSVT